MNRSVSPKILLLALLITLVVLLVGGFAPTAQGQSATKAQPTIVPTHPQPTLTPTLPAPLLLEPNAKSTLATPLPIYVPPITIPDPLVAADVCNQSQGQVSVHTVYSPSLGRKLRYRIYLPPCYEQAGRLFPVLYMFHGLNYSDSQWDKIGLDELVDAGIAAGDLPPMIIVMPNIWGLDRQSDGGPGSAEEAFVIDLLPHIEDNYCVWNAREGRAIGGLSRGAFWALEIAFRHPDVFASVGGHSPAVFWDNASPEYNPYYLAADAPNLDSLRIYLDVGQDDWLAKWVARFLERLDKRGLTYTFTTSPGGHDQTYWRSQAPNYIHFYAANWPTNWFELPTPPDCAANPNVSGCRNGLGLSRPCDTSLP